MRVQIPNVQAFDLDVLMLVIPESKYAKRVPVTLGTLHIDKIIGLVTNEQLKYIDKSWQRGIISRIIAIKTAQLKENKTILDKIKGEVKLTHTIKIPAYQTISTTGLTGITAHVKRVNIVTEPRENDDYMVPCYSFMKPGSQRASVALRNLTHKTIELKKGNIVASVQAANAIPLMLASKSPEDSNISKNNSSLTPEATPERIEK